MEEKHFVTYYLNFKKGQQRPACLRMCENVCMCENGRGMTQAVNRLKQQSMWRTPIQSDVQYNTIQYNTGGLHTCGSTK